MPELPEVETVARGLRQAILGRRILSVTLGKTDFIDDPAALEQHLPGRQIDAVERYGKFMLLLDQSVLRGVGNIYADESLWRARIHPARLGTKLSGKDAETLRRALQDILRKAIVLRGSSISDFLDAAGEPGEYQRHHRAYGREGKKCYRCKVAIRRAIVAGRSSYFCPRCQPSPRRFAALPLLVKNRRKAKRRGAERAGKSPRNIGKS